MVCSLDVKMLQSSPVKPSAPASHPAASVVTDPTLRLMAAAAAAAGGRSGRLAAGPPSELTPRPSVAAAAAANELYASLLYSHQHQLDRAAMLMQQHAHQSPFPAVPSAMSRAQQQQSQAPAGHAQPPQAHTGGFALPQYQPSHPHPHHLQAAGPAAAAAFESYSQSLATLSQLSQRLQLHAAPHSRLPAPPAALNVDPYLAAAAAAVQGGRAASPACKREQLSVNSPSKTPVTDSTGPVINTHSTPHQATRHRNPYDFCESDLSPDDKFHIRYKHDDVKESHQHRRHHHHHPHHDNSHHIQHQQQTRKSDVGVCHDENHNAFNDDYRPALQLHRRNKRPDMSITHAQTVLPLASPQHDQHNQPTISDTPSKGAVALEVTGNGSDVISESSEVLLSGRRSTAANYKSGYHRRHQRSQEQRADFTLGSMIQLSDGRVKRIEDMCTEDFVINSSSSSVKLAGVTSSQLVLVSSRVVHIRLNHDSCTAVLGFVVDNNIHSPVFYYVFLLFYLLYTTCCTSSAVNHRGLYKSNRTKHITDKQFKFHLHAACAKSRHHFIIGHRLSGKVTRHFSLKINSFYSVVIRSVERGKGGPTTFVGPPTTFVGPAVAQTY